MNNIIKPGDPSNELDAMFRDLAAQLTRLVDESRPPGFEGVTIKLQAPDGREFMVAVREVPKGLSLDLLASKMKGLV